MSRCSIMLGVVLRKIVEEADIERRSRKAIEAQREAYEVKYVRKDDEDTHK